MARTRFVCGGLNNIERSSVRRKVKFDDLKVHCLLSSIMRRLRILYSTKTHVYYSYYYKKEHAFRIWKRNKYTASFYNPMRDELIAVFKLKPQQ